MEFKGNCAVLLCALPLLAAAAEEEIVTDRPDFVESSNVVGKGRFQLETSIAIDRNKGDDGVRERLFSTPTLLRFGISDTVELRYETDGRLRARADYPGGPSVRESGYADSSLGVKWHALDAEGSRPSVGFLAHVDLDSGSAAFRAPGRGGSLRMAAEWELPDEYSLGVMPGLAWQRDDNGQRYTSGIFGIVLGKSWSDDFRTFIEYSAPQITRASHGGSVSTVDIGAAWLLSSRIQVDTALSRGLNRQTPDWSWTAGFSIKF